MSGVEIVYVFGGYMALFLYDRIDSYPSRGTLVSQSPKLRKLIPNTTPPAQDISASKTARVCSQNGAQEVSPQHLQDFWEENPRDKTKM